MKKDNNTMAYELTSRANAIGLINARVDFDGKNFRMNYNSKVYDLGPNSEDSMTKIEEVEPTWMRRTL